MTAQGESEYKEVTAEVADEDERRIEDLDKNDLFEQVLEVRSRCWRVLPYPVNAYDNLSHINSGHGRFRPSPDRAAVPLARGLLLLLLQPPLPGVHGLCPTLQMWLPGAKILGKEEDITN